MMDLVLLGSATKDMPVKLTFDSSSIAQLCNKRYVVMPTFASYIAYNCYDEEDVLKLRE